MIAIKHLSARQSIDIVDNYLLLMNEDERFVQDYIQALDNSDVRISGYFDSGCIHINPESLPECVDSSILHDAHIVLLYKDYWQDSYYALIKTYWGMLLAFAGEQRFLAGNDFYAGSGWRIYKN